MTVFLGHQGGWDELLWFLLPVALVALWVRWAEKRARKRQPEGQNPVANMPDDKTS